MVLEVKEIYKDIISQNEKLEPNEISKMIKERFKDKYYETKVIVEDLAKKSKRRNIK